MRPDLPARLPLVCPACRVRSERGREMHTLSLWQTLRAEEDGDVAEGILRCDNPACGRRYPIIDGIPVIVPDLPAFLPGQLAALADLQPEVEALLAEAGPDSEPLAQQAEHLSIYLDAHYGDRATPPPAGPGAPFPAFGLEALVSKLRARAAAPVGLAVELGCSVGRGVAELARGAALCVGVDLHLGALRRARRLLRGQELRYGRRVIGRHYRPAIAAAGALRTPSAAFLCADALDPPLVPGAAGRACALGVLDSVRWPGQLLSVLDGLLCPGGELLLSSPYSWQSGVVDEAGRLGGEDPAGDLRARLAAGAALEAPYVLEDEAELPWWLRRDERSHVCYRAHYLRARKGGSSSST